MPYGRDNLMIEERNKHPMGLDVNPFCPRCGLRTYPNWGPHDCSYPSDNTLAQHTAGNMLSNLYFYHVDAEIQIMSLAKALAYTIATNVHQSRLEIKTDAYLKAIKELIMREAPKGHTAHTAVPAAVNRPKSKRLKAKRASHGPHKTHRQNRQVIQTRKR